MLVHFRRSLLEDMPRQPTARRGSNKTQLMQFSMELAKTVWTVLACLENAALPTAGRYRKFRFCWNLQQWAVQNSNL
jgi:hypothetical protein